MKWAPPRSTGRLSSTATQHWCDSLLYLSAWLLCLTICAHVLLQHRGNDIAADGVAAVTFIGCDREKYPMAQGGVLPRYPTECPATWAELRAACQQSGTIALQAGPFDMADYDQCIALTNKQTITIVGNGAVLDARKKGIFFYVNSGSLTLDSITLENGITQKNGNQAGGAIYNGGGSLTVRSGTFLGNSADSAPGNTGVGAADCKNCHNPY